MSSVSTEQLKDTDMLMQAGLSKYSGNTLWVNTANVVLLYQLMSDIKEVVSDMLGKERSITGSHM